MADGHAKAKQVRDNVPVMIWLAQPCLRLRPVQKVRREYQKFFKARLTATYRYLPQRSLVSRRIGFDKADPPSNEFNRVLACEAR